MWFRATGRLPYHEDADFRDSVVASIKRDIGPVPVDVTLFPVYGIFEVQVATSEEAEALAQLPLVGQVRPAIDREMLCGPRTVV